jgi:hypothetical protein
MEGEMMIEIVCPNCAADLKIPPSPIHTCDYCGTAIQVSKMVGQDATAITGQEVSQEIKNAYIIKEHFIVRAQYNPKEAQSILIDWIKKIPGAPQDFETSATIYDRELVFYPLWVGEYSADSDYIGIDDWPEFSMPAFDKLGWYEHVSYYKKEESGRVNRQYQIPLIALNMEKIPKYLQTYEISTTGKEYFDITHIKTLSGKVEDSVFQIEEAKQKMYSEVINKQTSEIRKEVPNITARNDKIEERAIYYIHFPVYQIKFKYRNKDYQALIDGSSGRIIHTAVPLAVQYRMKTILTGSIFIIAATILILTGILTHIEFFGIGAGIGLIVIGILFFLLNIRRGAKEQAK